MKEKLKSGAFVVLLLCQVCLLQAQPQGWVTPKGNKSAFPLSGCTICYDTSDAVVVDKVAHLLAEDMQAVLGKPVPVTTAKASGNRILLGTLGHHAAIDALAASGVLKVQSLKGGWEQFAIQRVDDPARPGEKLLVIAGSDRRGTAYGAFTLSEAMGVSPWNWWADVPAQQHSALYVTADYTSASPSIKYRGIFINDEDWGLKTWSSRNYEKELGDIGPKTYARVCELLLRLKGNMLAPAMHSCTGAFYSHPESKEVADAYGILITTSHCEPMLFNNAAKSEWDSKRDGDWNYRTNKATILKKMDDRVREACGYENIYTMAMRGVHDAGLRGNLSPQERVAVLTEVMADQRDILRKYLKKPVTEIQQIFVPYKETLDVYENGLKVPEDITLVWPDDNYGYMKRLSNPEEQRRSGRSGVYYHLSYLGGPHDYLWICTTAPVLMYEELTKAYRTGADRYWLLNVGDIKPMELGIQTFFDLAWNVERFNYASIRRHQSQFLAGIYGQKLEKRFQSLLDTYYRLAWSRKPEFMGWEREWDAKQWANILPTDFSFQNYNDAQQRLADYEQIADEAVALEQALPEASRPSFFEMVGYSVQAASQMNRKFLMAQLNGELVAENRLAEANWAAQEAQVAFDSINTLTKRYNTQLNGKWDEMMRLAPGWVAKYQLMPTVKRTDGVAPQPVDLRPLKARERLERCTVLDLEKGKWKNHRPGQTLQLVSGIGYDGQVLLMGDAMEEPLEPAVADAPTVEYTFTGVDSDSLTVYLSRVPFFPLYKGRSTRLGVSVDGQPLQILVNNSKEYTLGWKDQVLQNGALQKVRFAVNPAQKKHVLKLTYLDPGVMVQRICLDWGGLKETYVGPPAQW